ncbi:MAG: hypothetical protein U5Q44_04515 [Dehalococcoidia bacterium]|nr:hypothetical protein [Dehalococcoidia bacterium]
MTADPTVFPALDRGYQEKYGMTLSEAGSDALILEVHPIARLPGWRLISRTRPRAGTGASRQE